MAVDGMGEPAGLPAGQSAPHDRAALLAAAAALRARQLDRVADTVLQAALRHFPGDLAVLEALVEAASGQGDDAALVASCNALLRAHPTHPQAIQARLDALERLGRLDEMAELLRAAADADRLDPAPLLRLATISEIHPAQALRHYATLRARHPARPEAHLGLARMLNALDRAPEADEALDQGHHRLPHHSVLAAAWARQALTLGHTTEAIRRAGVLAALAPDAPDAPQIEAEALLAQQQPEPALARLTEATRRFPTHFALAALRGQALARLGRWHEAARVGLALVQRFPHEPAAALALATALVRLGRAREAEAVLADARARCPGHAGMSAQLARLAAARGDTQAALTWWRDAGLPDQGPDSDRRAYALALAEQGEVDSALAHVRTTPSPHEPPWLRLAEAELLAAAGQGDPQGLHRSLALWHSLQPRFTLAEPAFAALTWRLATTLPPPDALAPLQALLHEPDKADPATRPALLRLLPMIAADDPVRDRLRQALAASPRPDTLARAAALAFTDPEPDTDTLAQRVIRAVRDGRPDVMALLLDHADHPARTPKLRIALRLALNRLAPDADAFAALTAPEIAALLLAARVFDTDSLAYLAALARPRFPPSQLPHLATSEEVVGCLVHRLPDPDAHRPTAPAEPAARLRVALCLHGPPPLLPPAQDPRAALALDAHEVSLFAHLWTAPAGDPPGAEAVLAALSPGLRSALRRHAAADGLDRLVQLYPDLFAVPAEPAPLTTEAARQRYRPAALVLEDQAQHAGRSPAWLRRHKVQQAHRLARQSGRDFDLVLHVAAHAVPRLDRDTPWRDRARAAAAGTIFADAPLQFRRGLLTMGDSLVAGAPAPMQLAADSFTIATYATDGRARIAGLAGPDIHRQCQPMLLHLLGVAVSAIPAPPAPVELPQVTPEQALARMWTSLKRRPAAAPDSVLMRIAVAEVTCGVPSAGR